ncbi:hypothetical protein ACJX0J_010760, partial [Zea mays]
MAEQAKKFSNSINSSLLVPAWNSFAPLGQKAFSDEGFNESMVGGGFPSSHVNIPDEKHHLNTGFDLRIFVDFLLVMIYVSLATALYAIATERTVKKDNIVFWGPEIIMLACLFALSTKLLDFIIQSILNSIKEDIREEKHSIQYIIIICTKSFFISKNEYNIDFVS